MYSLPSSGSARCFPWIDWYIGPTQDWPCHASTTRQAEAALQWALEVVLEVVACRLFRSACRDARSAQQLAADGDMGGGLDQRRRLLKASESDIE